MFEAYSIKKRRSIKIDDAVDLADTFKCLNSTCNAEFYVKGLNSGVVSKHFARKKTTPHIKGCPYILFNNNYVDNTDMVKSDLLDIYDHTEKKRIDQNASTFTNDQASPKSITRITTPKQLLTQLSHI